MPKIIEDAKEKILETAKKQVLENGYRNVTIRSVAKECQIGTGTIYNYFPSKDVLVASFLLEDWLKELHRLKKACMELQSREEVFEVIYHTLVDYNERYKKLFTDDEAVKNSGGVFRERHKQLRSQIVELIMLNEIERDKKRELIFEQENKTFVIEFIAEALLTWSAEKKSFEDLKHILESVSSNL